MGAKTEQPPEPGPTPAPESSPSKSPPVTSSDRPGGDEAEWIIRDAAEKSRVNAERHAADGPKPLAAGLDLRIKRVWETLGSEEVKAHNARVRETLEAERQRDRRARQERIERASNVPPKYVSARPYDLSALPEELDGVPVADAYAAKMTAMQRLATGSSVVALVGTRGPGKTWMACALVNSFCANGVAAEYHEISDYFLALKATYGDDAKSSQEAVEARWLRPRLLVLDEMQERWGSDWEDRMLVRLVNKRYAHEVPTVLVSNQDVGEFQRRAGPSIVDRINDGGAIIVCDWPSLRGRLG